MAWILSGLTVFAIQGRAAESDPYGISKPNSDSAQIKSSPAKDTSVAAKDSTAKAGRDSAVAAKPDSVITPKPDTGLARTLVDSAKSKAIIADTVKNAEVKSADTAKVAEKKVKRQRVVREVTVNTLDEMKGR